MNRGLAPAIPALNPSDKRSGIITVVNTENASRKASDRETEATLNGALPTSHDPSTMVVSSLWSEINAAH